MRQRDHAAAFFLFHRVCIEQVAEQLSNSRFIDLERLATAMWVTRQLGEDASLAAKAVQKIDALRAEARERLIS